MEVREVPRGGSEGAGVTGLVQGDLGDPGGAGEYTVAGEAAVETSGEDVVAGVHREVPGAQARSGSYGGRVQAVLQIFEDLQCLPRRFLHALNETVLLLKIVVPEEAVNSRRRGGNQCHLTFFFFFL